MFKNTTIYTSSQLHNLAEIDTYVAILKSNNYTTLYIGLFRLWFADQYNIKYHKVDKIKICRPRA